MPCFTLEPCFAVMQVNDVLHDLQSNPKGRGGKGGTLVKGLVLSEADMSALAKTLKQACGCGGTVKDDVIEIQGENRERIADTLHKLGYKVKVAGG